MCISLFWPGLRLSIDHCFRFQTMSPFFQDIYIYRDISLLDGRSRVTLSLSIYILHDLFFCKMQCMIGGIRSLRSHIMQALGQSKLIVLASDRMCCGMMQCMRLLQKLCDFCPCRAVKPEMHVAWHMHMIMQHSCTAHIGQHAGAQKG